MTLKLRTTAAMAATMLLAYGCDLQRLSTSTAPTSAPAAGGTGSGVGALVGLWASQSSASLSSACTSFQWNVTSQDATSMSGTFSAVCLGMFTISGTAAGQLESSSAVKITINATTSLPGIGACPVSLTANGTLEGDVIRVPYAAQTCVGNFSGTESLRRNTSPTPEPTPAPTPTPIPTPTPTPTPGPSPSADEFDLASATIVLGPQNIASWPQTSRITGTRAIPGDLCIWHERLGQWPSGQFFDDPKTLVEGNQWVFANIGGRWYGGAADWYRPGQACKDVTAESIGRDAFYNDHMEPLRSWQPRVGETFAVMSTTPARAWPQMRTYDERTNAVLVRWGQ